MTEVKNKIYAHVGLEKTYRLVKKMNFSIVVPVKDEIDLIPWTLPSYYAVNPSEVIICTDNPTPRKVRQVIQKVAAACDALDITRIVEVERDPEWKFHQAHVRQTGFKKAKYDRILNVDIDLVINKNVLAEENCL